MIPIIHRRLLHSSLKLQASIIDETIASISRSLPTYPGPPPPPSPLSSSDSSTKSNSDYSANLPSAILNSPMYKQQNARYQQQQLEKQKQQQQQQLTSSIRSKIKIPIQAEIEAAESSALNTLLIRLLGQLNSIFPSGTVPNLKSLLEDYKLKGNFVIEEELLYESNPKNDRKIYLENGGRVEGTRREGYQSGFVTVCHVYGNGKNSIVSTCSGFKVCETKEGEGDKIVTCAHTLTAMSRHFNSSNLTDSSLPEPPSASFILTSSGHIFPVISLLSSLPSSDILLLQISPEPMRDPSYALRSASSSTTTSASSSATPNTEILNEEVKKAIQRLVPKLNSLPINPYPAKNGSRIASLIFKHPMSQSGNRNLTSTSSSSTSTSSSNSTEVEEGKFDSDGREFAMGRIIEYQDSEGFSSSTGTYDELSSMSISTIPTAGSSGSPIIDLDSGSVVGLIRGSRHSYGDRTARGFATPAEKIFEMFQLPGMGKKNKKN